MNIFFVFTYYVWDLAYFHYHFQMFLCFDVLLLFLLKDVHLGIFGRILNYLIYSICPTFLKCINSFFIAHLKIILLDFFRIIEYDYIPGHFWIYFNIFLRFVYKKWVNNNNWMIILKQSNSSKPILRWSKIISRWFSAEIEKPWTKCDIYIAVEILWKNYIIFILVVMGIHDVGDHGSP